jgi:uncharacterized protein YegJ (DUF2314 family)
MNSYTAIIEHDHGWSEATIEAPDIDQALTIARTLTKDDYIFMEHYDVDLAATSIRVTPDHPQSPETERAWLDPGYAAERAIPELLAAARDIVANWESGDLVRAVCNLADIIDAIDTA